MLVIQYSIWSGGGDLRSHDHKGQRILSPLRLLITSPPVVSFKEEIYAKTIFLAWCEVSLRYAILKDWGVYCWNNSLLDLKQVGSFLTCLAGDEPVTFQTFADNNNENG